MRTSASNSDAYANSRAPVGLLQRCQSGPVGKNNCLDNAHHGAPRTSSRYLRSQQVLSRGAPTRRRHPLHRPKLDLCGTFAAVTCEVRMGVDPQPLRPRVHAPSIFVRLGGLLLLPSCASTADCHAGQLSTEFVVSCLFVWFTDSGGLWWTSPY